MDRLRAISVFVAIANAGSLSGAARSLDEPLTNISRLLAQLEDHLGLTLVERTTRRMALTAAGRDYLKACRRILDDLQNAENAFAGLSNEFSGDIAVTAPVGLGRLHVLPVVTAFLAAHPQINVRFLLADNIIDLMAEEIDVAVRVGKLRDSELRASRIGTLRMVACAAPRYLEQHGTPTNIAALADHDCVTFDELPGGTRWVFNSKRYGRNAARVQSRLSVNTADAAVAAATSGVGIARVLSYQAQAAIDSKQVVPILQRFDDDQIPVNLVYRPTRTEYSRVREFVRFSSTMLRAELRTR